MPTQPWIPEPERIPPKPDAKKVIIRNGQSPGDVLVMSAAIRDLHRFHPGEYIIDVRTSCAAIWENNPHVTTFPDNEADIEFMAEYPAIHRSNQEPIHFLHGFHRHFNDKLGTNIYPTEAKGDIHLSPDELAWTNQVESLGHKQPFWIIMAGGKTDFTAKWWHHARYQQVVNALRDKVLFVQCGELAHWHRPLDGAINLLGKTDLRQFIRLMHHADGVLCPVTFAMHLAAAVPTRHGKPKNRGAVVIAGGREPTTWEAYPHHQFLHTLGQLKCCEAGGCWKSRCHPIGDGDDKDKKENLCPLPVVAEESPGMSIPKCMDMITVEQVTRAIDNYYVGGALEYRNAPTAN